MRVAVPALALLLLLTVCNFHASDGGKLGQPAKGTAKAKGANSTATAAASRGAVPDDDGSARCGWMAPVEGKGDGFARTCYDGLCCSQYGFCGDTPEHCLATHNCQDAYGRCDNGAARFQTFDGTENNARNNDVGAATRPLIRLSSAAYADGRNAPAGPTRPSPRTVSNLVSQAAGLQPASDRDLSALVHAWGQLIDHDLSRVPPGIERWDVVVPKGDPVFDTDTTLPFTRSAYDLDAVGARIPVNLESHFLDASTIYGSSQGRAVMLRQWSYGKLRVESSPVGPMLPRNTEGLTNNNDGRVYPDNQLFMAGEARSNESPSLQALHNLFVREHNRRCDWLLANNPTWSDERLFTAARRFVIALVQKITFDEFLPSVLGHKMAPYTGYDDSVDPGVSVEFATVGFRALDSTAPGAPLQFYDGNAFPLQPALSLKDSQYQAPMLATTGIEGPLKFLGTARAGEVDVLIEEDLRSHLSVSAGLPPTAVTVDLAALNIQRGRDHGLPDYNTLRGALGLPKLSGIANMTTSPALRDALQRTYGDIENVDPWVGGLAEPHVYGGSLGALNHAIVMDQFTRTRAGDSWWYERPGVLDAATYNEVQRTLLVDVVRRNTNLKNIQDNYFFFKTQVGGVVFADLNGDGKRGRTAGGQFEPVLPSVRITVYDVPSVGGVAQPPVKIGEGLSGPTGVYLLSGQWSAGDKTVVADPVPGYNKLNPVGFRITKGGVSVVNFAFTAVKGGATPTATKGPSKSAGSSPTKRAVPVTMTPAPMKSPQSPLASPVGSKTAPASSRSPLQSEDSKAFKGKKRVLRSPEEEDAQSHASAGAPSGLEPSATSSGDTASDPEGCPFSAIMAWLRRL